MLNGLRTLRALPTKIGWKAIENGVMGDAWADVKGVGDDAQPQAIRLFAVASHQV
jgi:hypothetical protein